MARIALDGSIHGAKAEFRLWPTEFTLVVFSHVLSKPSQSLMIPGLLRNSLIVSGGAALITVVFGLSMAYAFARYRIPGRQIGLFIVFLGAFLPTVALVTTLYIRLSSIGIRTNLLGLVIVYTAVAMPFYIWNMRNAFRAVPIELEEAAFLDGVSFFDISIGYVTVNSTSNRGNRAARFFDWLYRICYRLVVCRKLG